MRRKQLQGVRFRRQHPISRFIVDFYCHQANLVIEVDGNVHLGHEQGIRDENRQYELEKFGLKVIRFNNDEVLDQLPQVLQKISNELPV